MGLWLNTFSQTSTVLILINNNYSSRFYHFPPMISKMALSIFLGIGFEFGILISSQPLCALNPERLTVVSEKW